MKVIRFCHMLLFLKEYISERADLLTIIKRSIVEEIREEVMAGKKRKLKTLTGFN